MDDCVFGIVVYLFTMLIGLGAEWKVRNANRQIGAAGSNDVGKEFLQLILLIAGMIALLIAEPEEFLILLCMVLPFTVIGYICRNPIYKFGAGAVQFGYAIFAYPESQEISIICQFLILALIHVLMYQKKDRYTTGYKIWIYLLTQLFLVSELYEYCHDVWDSYDAADTAVFILLLVYNLIMRKFYATNMRTGEPEKKNVYNIINVFMMISGMIYIEDFENGALHLVIIMATLVVFMINVKNLLENAQGLCAGIYVGIKFTILMIVILASFEVENYIVSIFCFLFAIISVCTGFMLKYKSLRIYGIVLSMLSIFKLLMLDISYANTLGNAFSFFASGMLCFVISMIYNYVDKKFALDEESFGQKTAFGVKKDSEQSSPESGDSGYVG